MSLEEVRKLLREHALIPLWPTCGRALHLSRGQTYSAAAEGSIEVIEIGPRKRVRTQWLGKKLGLDEPRSAASSKTPR